jgi:hypothetical protein
MMHDLYYTLDRSMKYIGFLNTNKNEIAILKSTLLRQSQRLFPTTAYFLTFLAKIILH